MLVRLIYEEADEEGFARDVETEVEMVALPRKGEWVELPESDNSWVVQLLLWRVEPIREDAPIGPAVVVGYRSTVEVLLKEPD